VVRVDLVPRHQPQVVSAAGAVGASEHLPVAVGSEAPPPPPDSAAPPLQEGSAPRPLQEGSEAPPPLVDSEAEVEARALEPHLPPVVGSGRHLKLVDLGGVAPASGRVLPPPRKAASARGGRWPKEEEREGNALAPFLPLRLPEWVAWIAPHAFAIPDTRSYLFTLKRHNQFQ